MADFFSNRFHRIAWTLFSACAYAAAQNGPNDTVWTKLFNGVDLKDWDIKVMGQALNVDPRNTWRVVNGNIEVNYSSYTNWNGEPWSHAEYKVRDFSYYVLKVENQFYGTQVPGAPGYANQNSGVMLHSQKLSTMALNQNWPISLENQLIGPASGEGTGTCNLCTPGTAMHNADGSLNNNHCIHAATNTRTFDPAWTKTSSVVLGDSVIKHLVEGKVVLTYYKPVEYSGIVTGNTVPITNNKALTRGYIQLQSESAPIRFRNIEIALLEGCKDPASPNYKSYYVKSLPSACVPSSAAEGARGFSPGWNFQPGNRSLTVNLPGSYSLRVSGLDGRTEWTRQGLGKADFDLSSLEKGGVHFLTISHAGGVFTHKLLIDR